MLPECCFLTLFVLNGPPHVNSRWKKILAGALHFSLSIWFPPQKAKMTCNDQARVERPATKGYDDMKQWISSEDATTLPCITIVAALPEHVPNMVSQNSEAPLCHRRMKIVTKYFTFIYTYMGIYIHLIYVVHAPAYASSHQTLL